MLENAGFQNVKVSHDPFYRDLGTSVQKLAELTTNLLFRQIAKATAMLPLKGVAVPLNLYDIMTATARKSH